MKALARVAGWWAMLAGLAYICAGSAADRLAGQGLLVAAPTPLLTGGDALGLRAWAAYRRGDVAAAHSLSRAALRRRPIDAAVLRTAGLSAIAAGDARAGDALMRLAGAGGWRDVPTQLYWAQAALDAGAVDVVAERLDAIRRASRDPDAGVALLHALERSPAGRAALVRRLSASNDWLAAYLPDLRGLDDAGIAARIATVVLARRAGLSGDALDTIGQALVARGRADLAYRLAAPGATLAFEGGHALPGPFAWSISAVAGLDATIDRGGLHALASGPVPLPLATRLMRLPAGVSRLDAALDGARTDAPLIATLDCMGGAAAAAEQVAARPGHITFLLRVPAACPTQRLSLAIAGEEARRGADLRLAAPVIGAAAAP